VYEAYSLLRVRQGPGLLYDVGTEFMSLPAQIQLIKSPVVMNAALAMPGVSDLPWIRSRMPAGTEVEWLAQQVEVRSIGGKPDRVGEVLRISMKGEDPKQLQALVNAVTEAYRDRVAGEERRQLVVRREQLEKAFYK